jgi:hypothetical protein
MMLSKGLTRFGLVAAVAALMLTVSMSLAETATAQTPPAVFYGKGLKSGDKVEATIGGKSCGTATANAAGEWSISVQSTATCAPTANAAVAFTLNGGAATSTPAATWQGGGLPPDVANGYVLAAGAAAVTPPKTGNAGLLGTGSDATSSMLVLALAVLALGTVAGARVYAGRGR